MVAKDLTGTCVVDCLGRPLALFHGTSAAFEAFAPNPRGIFFAQDIDQAAPYSRIRKGTPRIITAHLDVRNPWTMIRYGDDVPYSHMAEQSPAALRARGFDAMHDPLSGVWIVFDPAQIVQVPLPENKGTTLGHEPGCSAVVHHALQEISGQPVAPSVGCQP